MNQNPGSFDEASAWSELKDLSRRLISAEAGEIYDALQVRFQSLIQELKARESPIPPSVLNDPMLRPQFVGNSSEVKPTEPPHEELLFGVPAVRPNSSDEQENEEPPLTPPTPEQLAEAESLIRNAKVAQMRGNRDEAISLLKQAENAAPGASTVIEAVGDELLAAGKVGEARKYYRRAKVADPSNVSAERKFAELVFRSEASAATAIIAESEVVANARSAAILSFLVPGLGQIVRGRIATGITFIVLVFGLWALAFALGLKGALAQMLNAQTGRDPYNPLVFAIVPAAVILYFINVADVSSRAKMASTRSYERPPPPENLPFE